MYASSIQRPDMTHGIGCVANLDSGTIEEKADRGELLALTLAECTHQLFQFGGSLDFEEYFIVAICNLDVEMLATCRRLRLRTVGGLVVVRHIVGVFVWERLW